MTTALFFVPGHRARTGPADHRTWWAAGRLARRWALHRPGPVTCDTRRAGWPSPQTDLSWSSVHAAAVGVVGGPGHLGTAVR